ncbi:MAG TPA: hypothetical protein VGG33_07900 [Polyangia bacterium]
MTTSESPTASAESRGVGPREMYAPPSREQLFWARRLAWLLAPSGRPSALARAWGVMAVAPFAHITFLSVPYQAYLYDVFHLTKNARFWHQLCMPLNNLMIMVALGSLTVAGVNAASLYAVLLLGWYLAQAIVSRLVLWGLVMIPLVGALYLGAGVFREATATAGWLESPFLWMALLSFAQAFSHITEPRLPPRVTGGPHWKTVREFLAGEPPAVGQPAGGQLIRLVRLAAQVVWGTVAEFWASPRLFPYGVLVQMRRLGYGRTSLDPLSEMVRRAVASGQPAVDYIGSGGGAFLPVPAAPATVGSSEPEGSVSRNWRRLFCLEIPLTFGACAYWAFAARTHLEAAFGAGTASGPALALLSQLTAVVFTLVVWFYGRWLFSPGSIALRPFRYLQEGFALGDVALILLALQSLRDRTGESAVWIAQAGMAALWLALRLVFLLTQPAIRSATPAGEAVGASPEQA